MSLAPDQRLREPGRQRARNLTLLVGSLSVIVGMLAGVVLLADQFMQLVTGFLGSR